MKNKNANIPTDVAEKLADYMGAFKYSPSTIRMRLGNLNFLYGHYGKEKMAELLSAGPVTIHDSVKYINDTLPPGCIVTADVNAFKLTWESLTGNEIIKKRKTLADVLNDITE